MKSIFLLFALSIYLYNCSFLKQASISLDNELLNSSNNSGSASFPDLNDRSYFSNELVPGLNDVTQLKKIIQELVIKLDGMQENKNSSPHFKYLEVRMPSKGREIKIKHNLSVEDIISVNVMILNGTNKNLIMRSQVDLITQKVLYNWYIDNDNLVIIRPNNVRVKSRICLLFIIYSLILRTTYF